MTGRVKSSKGAWRDALAGAACGALAAALYYFYSEATGPSPYNILLIGHAPVFMTFGGMAGLLVWAMRDSEIAGGRREGRASRARERAGALRGLLIGAGCGALVTLLYWLHLELSRPSAYGRFVVLTFGAVLTIFCGVAGFVFGATRDHV